MKIFLSILKTPVNIPNNQLWEMNVSVENIACTKKFLYKESLGVFNPWEIFGVLLFTDQSQSMIFFR